MPLFFYCAIALVGYYLLFGDTALEKYYCSNCFMQFYFSTAIALVQGAIRVKCAVRNDFYKVRYRLERSVKNKYIGGSHSLSGSF